MQEETVSEDASPAETQAEAFPDDLQETMIPCPNCKEMVPTSLYCLKCGYPLYMFRKEEESEVVLGPEEGAITKIQELTKDLMNSISLMLWSVDQMQEGGMEEEHFVKLFDEYRARSVQCIGQRKMLLTHYSRELASMARELEPYEKSLKEVKVNLRELEMRRSIGDLHEGEYEAKSPAYNWEIQYYEKDIARRRGDMKLLQDITKIIPAMEIDKAKDKVGEANVSVEAMLKEGAIGPETATRVRLSMDETSAFLDTFR